MPIQKSATRLQKQESVQTLQKVGFRTLPPLNYYTPLLTIKPHHFEVARPKCINNA